MQETADYQQFPYATRQFHADTLELEATGLYWYYNPHQIVLKADLTKIEEAFGYYSSVGKCPVAAAEGAWHVAGDSLYMGNDVIGPTFVLFTVVNDTMLANLEDGRHFVHVSATTPHLPHHRSDLYCPPPAPPRDH